MTMKQNITGQVVDAAFADTEVYTTLIDDSAKVFYVESGDYTGLFTIDNNVVVAVSAGAIFSATKDTASKINVYVESNVVKIQNNSGADITPVIRPL